MQSGMSSDNIAVRGLTVQQQSEATGLPTLLEVLCLASLRRRPHANVVLAIFPPLWADLAAGETNGRRDQGADDAQTGAQRGRRAALRACNMLVPQAPLQQPLLWDDIGVWPQTQPVKFNRATCGLWVGCGRGLVPTTHRVKSGAGHSDVDAHPGVAARPYARWWRARHRCALRPLMKRGRAFPAQRAAAFRASTGISAQHSTAARLCVCNAIQHVLCMRSLINYRASDCQRSWTRRAKALRDEANAAGAPRHGGPQAKAGIWDVR